MKKFLHSTRHALRGKKVAFLHARNFRTQIVLGLLVLCVGWFVGLSRLEWVVVLNCIGMVLAAEMFNSSIELLSDRVTKENDSMIRDVKDCAAGAVLAVSIITAVVGSVIFWPYLVRILS